MLTLPKFVKEKKKKTMIGYLNPFKKNTKSMAPSTQGSSEDQNHLFLEKPLVQVLFEQNLKDQQNNQIKKSPRTEGLIDRIFDTYHNLALEKSHKNLYLFTFNIDDYILSNKKYPDYLNLEEDLSITDSKNDFMIKSECYYMTNTSEVRGEIYLKKNTLEFI